MLIVYKLYKQSEWRRSGKIRDNLLSSRQRVASSDHAVYLAWRIDQPSDALKIVGLPDSASDAEVPYRQ